MGRRIHYHKRFLTKDMKTPAYSEISGVGRYIGEVVNGYEMGEVKGTLQHLALNVPDENLSDLEKFVNHKLEEGKDQAKFCLKMAGSGLGMLAVGGWSIYSGIVNKDSSGMIGALLAIGGFMVGPTLALFGTAGYTGSLIDIYSIKKAKSIVKNRLRGEAN